MAVMAAALPVLVFAVNPGKAAWTVPGGGTTVMTVRGPAGSVGGRLAGGRLRSPCCGAGLARGGGARRRGEGGFTGPGGVRPRRGPGRRGAPATVLRDTRFG